MKTSIYLVENCYNDYNKVYIGKTKNSRRNPHEKTYGENISYTVIDEVYSLDKKDWKPLECFWICYFRFLGFKVLNKNEGGGGVIQHTKESIEKYKLWRKDKKPMLGKKQSKITKKRKSDALKGRPKPEGFGDMMRKVRLGKPKPKDMGKKVSISISKPIIQCTLDGKDIKEWKNGKQASIKLKIPASNISLCCHGKAKTTGGFKWKFKI